MSKIEERRKQLQDAGWTQTIWLLDEDTFARGMVHKDQIAWSEVTGFTFREIEAMSDEQFKKLLLPITSN